MRDDVACSEWVVTGQSVELSHVNASLRVSATGKVIKMFFPKTYDFFHN